MALPPPPPGFVPDNSRRGMFGAMPRRTPAPPPGFDVDPLASVHEFGNVTSGFRDRRRNARVGGVPNSLHMDADAIDLTPRKGVSWSQLRGQADQIATQWGRGARVVDESNTKKPHIHLQLPGWGGAPGLPPVPSGFQPVNAAALPGVTPTGRVHDGDTFRLSNGKNARGFGWDAFELAQQGRSPTGEVIPLGQMARNALEPFAQPNGSLLATGATTYGRPVVSLNNGGDAGQSVIRDGLALASPEYLRGTPQFAPYMEAERLARQNLLGAHGNTYQTPASFRAGNPDPWEKPEAAEYGKGQAVFWDEPTPQYGLRPEIEKDYVQFLNSNVGRWKKTPDEEDAKEIAAWAAERGFSPSNEDTLRFLRDTAKGKTVGSDVSYAAPPTPMTNVGDGATGAFVRGFGDPFNALDELGGLANTVVPGSRDFDGPRENIWNSGRRFGDIWHSNKQQNRAILQYDDEKHPVARFGGQLGSALIIPGVNVEGVAARAGAKALEEGASGFVASQIATRAGARRAGVLGGVEGGLAGFGAGEGGVIDRLPNTAAGIGAGAVGGYALGGLYGHARALYQTLRARGVPEAEALAAANRVDPGDVGLESTALVNAGAQNVGPTPASRSQPRGGVLAREAAMRMDDESAELVGPVAPLDRERDYINIPPAPEGFVPESLMGATRRVDERATAGQIANLANRVMPQDIAPLPQNRILSFDEFQKVPGRFEELQAPNPADELAVRRIPSSRDLFKGTRIRGPFDVTKQVRRWGGVQDQGGELSHLGITNDARKGLEFGGNEQFLGRLVNNENGLTLDALGERLYDEGWLNDRPTVAEVVDILHREHLGESLYHPETLGEVGAFRAAREEADRIDKYRDEGAPLVEERGAPVTFEDLAGNEPPAIAYEELPHYAARAGNISTGALDTKEDIARALINTERMFGGFDAARRGKISHAETQALAEDLGMRADDLLKRRHGQAFNAEQALAARAILAKSADELVKLAEGAKGGSDDALVAFRAGLLRHAAIQEQVSGMTAEAGRTLSQFRAQASASRHRERILKQLIENHGGRDNLEEAAQAIIDLQKVPGSLNKFARDAGKPTWKDKAVELWYNSLLSGPQTHAVNIVSNALTASLQIPEHATAAAIGLGRAGANKLLGKQATDRVLMSELGPRVVGLAQGALEGMKAFRYTLKTGNVPDLVSKVETAQEEAISGLKGKIIRTPTRLLSAEDEFFKAVARRSEIASLAVRRARAEGLRGDALSKRIDDLTANPTPEMLDQALDFARYTTFQRPVGNVAGAVLQMTRSVPALKLFLPFVRTPTNILKFAVERSPAAPLLKEVRADFMAGGAKRDLAVAKATLGTGLGLLITQLVASGDITGGGPADENAKRLMLADGWQPYSVKLGGKYYSYQRLDPLATTLGVAADFVDLQSKMTERQADEVAETVVASIISNLSDKTWLSGASDLVSAIHDPQRYGSQLVNRLAGSIAIPAGGAQLARTIDETPREVKTPLEAVKARIPGLSDNLRPRLDAWGRPMPKEGGVGPDIVSPFFQSTPRDEAINREALAIGATVSDPSRTVAGRRLDDAEFHEYRALAGQLVREDFARAIANPEWRGLSIQQRRKAFDEIKREGRKTAREMLGIATGDEGQEVAIPPPPPGFAR